MLFVVFRPTHINALTCRLVILYQGREPPSVSPLLCHMSLEMAASCRLLRRSLMHTFHNHWNLFAIISLLVNLAMLPLTNAQERILVSYVGHNETVGPLWVAAPFNRLARELIVRNDIESPAALREKIVGVQSIGGGFWLQTMIVLDRLGVDPDKSKLQMRVIGDEPTILQALL